MGFEGCIGVLVGPKSCHLFYDHRPCSKHEVVIINGHSDCSEQGAHWFWPAGAGIGYEMRLGRH